MRAHDRTHLPDRNVQTHRFAARMLPSRSKRLGQRPNAGETLGAKLLSDGYLVAIG